MTQIIARTSKGPIEHRFERSGPTIVFLNGGNCSRETRLSHEKLTEHGFSVLTLSRPGYDSSCKREPILYPLVPTDQLSRILMALNSFTSISSEGSFSAYQETSSLASSNKTTMYGTN